MAASCVNVLVGSERIRRNVRRRIVHQTGLSGDAEFRCVAAGVSDRGCDPFTGGHTGGNHVIDGRIARPVGRSGIATQKREEFRAKPREVMSQ